MDINKLRAEFLERFPQLLMPIEIIGKHNSDVTEDVWETLEYTNCEGQTANQYQETVERLMVHYGLALVGDK